PAAVSVRAESGRARVLAVLAVVVALAGAAGPARADIAVRKDVKDMTAQEKKDFINAVIKLKHTRSPFGTKNISLYDVFVYYHRRVSNLKVDGAHRGPAFLPWHREFLYAFEAALENVSHKKNLAIPYWDWTDPASTAAVFAKDFMGGNGFGPHHAVIDGPFRRGRWKITVPEQTGSTSPFEPTVNHVAGPDYLQRNLGGSGEEGVTSLPTAAQMDRVLAVSGYDAKPWNANSDPRYSFRCALEGWGRPDSVDERGAHNQVHLWVGGEWQTSAGRTEIGTISGAASPNDPVFWLIHSNIERLWQQWEQVHGDQYEPESGAAYGHNLRDPLSQFGQLGLGITGVSSKKLRPIDLLDPAPLQAVYQQPLPNG
ncbi:MAG: putative tyrosinase, partial [Solirubrobacteraceae bacterium]|nr:putative tyrosinase [Solirubrobacteraceae bacterium]